MTKRDFLLCAGAALCLGGCACAAPENSIPTCKAEIIRGPDKAIQSVEMGRSPCILRSVSGFPAPLPFPGKEPGQ